MKLYRQFRTKWLIIYFGIIFLLSFSAFLFSEYIPFIASADSVFEKVIAAVYCSLSLFIMGGVDIGNPSGEVLWIKSVLWISYVWAPLISVSYLTTFIQKKLLDRIPKSISNHTAIMGFGRSGSLLYDFHRESKPHDNIIIVDKIAPANKDEYVKNPSTWLIEKDFLTIETLKKIKIEKSRRIYITTNKDFVNVVCLSVLLDYFEGKKMPRIICQISDPFFRKDVKKLYETAGKKENIEFYNGYKSACEYLLQEYIAKQLNQEEQYLHVFLGYGIFAFCLQEVMLGSQDYSNNKYLICTKRKDDGIHNKWINEVEAKITRQSVDIELIIDDIYNVDFWKLCQQKAKSDKSKLVFYICTDDDLSNMQLAIMLKQSRFEALNDSLIFIRAFQPLSGMFRALTESKLTKGEQKDVIVLPVSEGLKEGFKKIFVA